MQRFRVMKVYVASVLLVVIVAITSAVWLRPSQADATRADADSLPDSAPGTSQADGLGRVGLR
jgi:hypothetical protein